MVTATVKNAKKVRDVSRQPRDERGRWTDVVRLTHNLADIGAPQLHNMIERYHWFHGSSGLAPRGARRIKYKTKPWYDFAPPPDPLEEHKLGSDTELAHYMDKLDPKDKGTLHKLAYGDIPADWGRDPAYIAHLRTWAKGSKLTSANGLPYRLFHGSGTAFNKFSKDKLGSHTLKDDAYKAFFFSTSPEDAGYFSFYGLLNQPVKKEDTPTLYPVHVRLKKPLVVFDKSGELDMVLSEHTIDVAKSKGYDGVVIYPNETYESMVGKKVAKVQDRNGFEVSVFEPKLTVPRVEGMVVAVFSQRDIKSAVGNTGVFGETSDLGKSDTALLLISKAQGKHHRRWSEESQHHRRWSEEGDHHRRWSDEGEHHVQARKVFFEEEADNGLGRIPWFEEEHTEGFNAGETPSPVTEKTPILKEEHIEYNHPNYPSLKRKGKVLARGRDGYLVLHMPSGHEERVRHEHVIKPKGKSDKAKTPIEKSFGGLLANGPNNRQDDSKSSTLSKWKPAVARLPYNVGHAVVYQRPDMGEPKIARIETVGRHGAMLSLGNGAKHKVRWEHVRGKAQAGIAPVEHQDAAEALQGMGIPMDPLETLLTGSRKPRIDSHMADRLKVLTGAGAPVDLKRAAEASPDVVQRLFQHLTGSPNNR